jgi:hypothetical protein
VKRGSKQGVGRLESLKRGEEVSREEGGMGRAGLGNFCGAVWKGLSRSWTIAREGQVSIPVL